MNIQIFCKLLFSGSCLISLLAIQPSFNSANIAQARETIVLDDNLTTLSTQEQANLDRGKVVLKGQRGKYLGRVVATGNLDTAWSVLTDYDNFDRFLPNITASKIISENGDRIVFEQTNMVDLWLFQEEFTVQIAATKFKPSKVDFQLADGELKKLIGRWQIEEISPGKILISHAVEVEPGSNTEKPFFYGVYESSLEETLKAIAIEINKRS